MKFRIAVTVLVLAAIAVTLALNWAWDVVTLRGADTITHEQLHRSVELYYPEE